MKNSLSGRAAALAILLNSLATLQLVWFYQTRVPAALRMAAYEQGVEKKPFQYRLLMMAPMRWAHHSAALQALAHSMTLSPGWFPQPVHAEGIAQGIINLVCVAIAGLVARSLYQAGSRTRLLTPFIYPLTLLMIAATYTFQTTHALRFVYDLPALGFFAAGIYLIYFRYPAILFAAVFLVGTLNRETTLLLLPFYAITQCLPESASSLQWRKLKAPATVLVVLPLSVYWLGWHVWVVRHFAHNASAAGPRLLLNLGIAAIPLSWPQVLSVCAYLWPFVFCYRRLIPDFTLRAWVWILPLWFAFMLWFGLLIEPRIFGELIPVVACLVMLVAEELLLNKLESQRTADS